MAIVFLSDVHLSVQSPDITHTFLRYLDTLCATPPEGVFILGDLFNVWYGDHVHLDDPFIKEIAQALCRLSERCPVFYQHGNRDFLLGKVFAHASGLTLLPERFMFEWAGQRILIEHGDLLCTEDVGYQRLRRILRQSWLRKLSARLPKWLLRFVGQFLRQQSRKRTAKKSSVMVDVNAQAVETQLAKYSVDYYIHGHTHRPACHSLPHQKHRIVLGDWRPQGEVFILSEDKTLLTFPCMNT